MNIKNKYAEIYIDIKALNVNRPFDYRIPPNLLSGVYIGVIVRVPFKNRFETGYVIKTKSKSELHDREIKDIKEVISRKPVFNPKKLKLIKWISRYYVQPFGSAAKFFIPPGEKGRKSAAKSRVKLKYRDYLSLDKDKYNKYRDKINWKKNYSKKKIIDYLGRHNEILKEKLIKDTGCSYSNVNFLIQKGIISVTRKRHKRDFKYEYKRNRIKKKITLNPYQKNAISSIENVLDKDVFHKILIEGVTGSGKTDIYIAACRRVLKNNKRALILTPEISLIPQLFSRFQQEFGDGVGVYHSNMNVAERYERWLDIWNDRFEIIIGTRSSIFTPLNNLGIIIIDEEHDSSYKEGTGVRYNTGEVAMKMGGILGIPVVMGSATPSIVTRYRSENEKDFTLIKIPVKAQSSSPLEMKLIDLKKIDYRKEDVTVTGELFKEVKNELEKNNKVIIFLNRRGYSNFVICSKCGNVPKCPACDLPYNYHRDKRKLMCHHCGREKIYTGRCDVCGASSMTLYGTGIQKVQSKLEARFKEVPVLRMDSDATVKKKSHQEILKKFISPGGSILIGTQMIAKGLDIEDITLVGIINSDGMLGLPDYHMNERIYQLITQVSGRAGRKKKKGKVIIQTYNPESMVMKNVLRDDYESFYRQELESRRELRYPPFSDLINIIVSGKDEKMVKKDINELAPGLHGVVGEEDSVLGPAPAPFYKINRFYRWHIMIKAKDLDKLSGRLAELLKRFKKFDENRIIIDINPVWIL
ncbi:MAG: primosomal protein N' [Actinomycetota bacterium]|nr:primosomal protein N' [Actinomycetota bacterium]